MKMVFNFNWRTTGACLWLLVASLSLSGCGSGSDDSTDAGAEIGFGQAFVEQRGCATCHQSTNSGVLAGQITPRPGTTAYGSNLTPDHLTGIGDWADIEIVRALRFGVDNQQLPLCSPMPHFADMTDVEANAIVAYLRSLPAVKQAIPNSTCPPLKPAPPVDMAVVATPDMAVPLDGAVSD
jgi:nicotinate dehydrogenase subunit B